MAMAMHEVADAVRALKKWTDAIATLGAYVEDLASLEQAAGEINVRLAAKRDEEAKQDERLARLGEAIALAEADIKRSQIKATETEQAASRAASTVTANARREADRIIDEARAEAERLKGPLNREIADLQARAKGESENLAGIIGAKAEALAELDALNSQISKARKAIADLLKG